MIPKFSDWIRALGGLVMFNLLAIILGVTIGNLLWVYLLLDESCLRWTCVLMEWPAALIAVGVSLLLLVLYKPYAKAYGALIQRLERERTLRKQFNAYTKGEQIVHLYALRPWSFSRDNDHSCLSIRFDCRSTNLFETPVDLKLSGCKGSVYRHGRAEIEIGNRPIEWSGTIGNGISDVNMPPTLDLSFEETQKLLSLADGKKRDLRIGLTLRGTLETLEASKPWKVQLSASVLLFP